MTLARETISPREKRQRAAVGGFSLIELLVVAAVLLVVLGGVVSYITIALQRSKAEQTKVDLTQEGRAFVDEFERDIHQAGYPNCRMFNTGSNCSAHFNDHTMAAGLVSVSSTQIGFEGDVDGDGNVDTVWYRLVDSAGNFPPTGTCPCTIQRAQVNKVDGPPLSQIPLPPQFSHILRGGDHLQRLTCIFGVRPEWQHYIAATGHYYCRRPAGSVLQFGDCALHQVRSSDDQSPGQRC